MGKIKILNEILTNKIAAGEVVERLVSVVKELVENSIDAKSTNIKIDLLNSGIKEIKVTDNGSGMSKEDALLSFSSHATSKIKNEQDLNFIASLGFRGEALASIASVSEVILKTSMGKKGTVINVKGGKILKESVAPARKGTIIIVKNLFYNTPARLKHLSSLYHEQALIVDYINKIALSYPNISFSLTNDKKSLFLTDGLGKQLKVIKEIYGIEVVKKMLKIEGSNDDYEISGFISYPEVTKSNRNSLITLVNGRVVRNFELNKALNEAYHTYKPEDRFPIVILNIKTDPSLIDVNIHPIKLDIKFSKFNDLKELIYQEIQSKLKSISLIPEIKEKEENYSYEEITLEIERKVAEPVIDYSIFEELKEEEESNKIPELYPIGAIQGTYLVCQNEKGMYLIDQHAANERINYEYYLKKLGQPTLEYTSLLVPITIELSNNEYLILKENMEVLINMGFEVDEIGINTILIRSHPLWLPKNYEEEAIRKIIDVLIIKEKDFRIEKFNESIAIMISCKMSIKANENISIREMETLIDNLRSCLNPWTCPHGRPVIVFYSNYELERMFKRS